jgi:thioredoxin 1
MKIALRLTAVFLTLGMAFAAGHAQPQNSSFSTDLHRDIYPDPASASADVASALHQAAREHKRVLLDFGGNWCGDCKVLNYYMHQAPNDALLSKYFILVDINIGRLDQNLALADKYQTPIKKGVPLIAILDDHGHLLYSQLQGGFDRQMRTDPTALTALLNQWKSAR